MNTYTYYSGLIFFALSITVAYLVGYSSGLHEAQRAAQLKIPPKSARDKLLLILAALVLMLSLWLIGKLVQSLT